MDISQSWKSILRVGPAERGGRRRGAEPSIQEKEGHDVRFHSDV